MMARITITIDTDNAAFEDAEELAGILRVLSFTAGEYGDGRLRDDTIQDSNGNTVGSVTVSEVA
jgi:hypothetical protein